MPLFGRKRRDEPGEDWARELPDDLEVPEGMAAVPERQIDEWADQIVTAATERASSPATPGFVNLYSKIALQDVCGPERAKALPSGAGLLAYNLRLHGYWCRAEEMTILKQLEPAPSMALLLTNAHDTHQLDWFQTVQWAAHRFSHSSPEQLEGLDVLPQDTGEDFRRRLAAVCIHRMAATVDAQHSGSSSSLTPEELDECWSTGYWLRATSISLPDAAHAEFATNEAGAG